MSNQTESFTNDVLSELYWAINRNEVKPYILAPVGISKFKEKDWAYSGVFGGLFKITKSIWEFAVETLKKIGRIVKKVVENAADLVEKAAGGIKWIPWILGGGIVAVVGFQVYNYKNTGKFYGEDMAKDLIGKKAGLMDSKFKKKNYRR